ncbi:MAG: hypothetical protein QXK11_07295 [Pyrobaculum sp.]|uniref:hypothetical protein n=1 Tax=Pyrobaculum sp. TaxID=2004705 RepID=UPI003173B702
MLENRVGEKEITFYAKVWKRDEMVLITVPKELYDRKLLVPGDVVRVTVVKVTRFER